MLKKLVFLFLFNCVFLFCQSQQTSLSKIKNEVQELYQQQRYDSLMSIINIDLITKASNRVDSLISSELLHIFANTYYEKAKYFKAIKLYNKSINISPNSEKGLNQKGRVLYDKAFAEYEIQNYTKSYQTVKKAEAILSTLKEPDYDYLLSIYADLAGEATTLGFYEDAEFYLNKGFALYKNNSKNFIADTNNASKPVLFHHKYVRLFAYSGNEGKLLKHINKLQHLKNKKEFNDIEHLMLAVAYNYVGDYFLEKYKKSKVKSDDDLKKGLKYVNNGLRYLEKENHVGNYTQMVFNKVKYHRYNKTFTEALTINDEILELLDKKDNRLPFFKAQQALIYLDSGLKNQALITYREVVKLIHSSDQALDKSYSNFKPSSVINHAGILVELADEFTNAYPNDKKILNEMALCYRLSLMQLTKSYKNDRFSKSLKEFYNRAISGLLRLKAKGYSDSSEDFLLEQIEAIENRITWNSFLQNRSLFNENEELAFNQEIHLRRQLVDAIKKNDSTNISDIKFNIEKKTIELQEHYPNIYKYAYRTFNISDLKNKLDDKTVVLKYKIIDSSLYTFEISKQSTNLTSKVFTQDLKTKIESYINEIKGKGENKLLAKDLWQFLKPSYNDSYQKLIILPDGVLTNLPFETLVLDDDYLVMRKTISYATHLVFLENEYSNNVLNEVALFSPEYSENNSDVSVLKGAQIEKKILSEMFSDKLTEIDKNNKHEFFENAKDANILHLAMHAVIDKNNPELSYFIFEENNTNNKLYLEELYALKLKANLAVLSACNTGVGLGYNVNGSPSIQRAFFMAGVPATISSLWDAPDNATQQIITNFYSYLKEGIPKSVALNKAKIKYLQNIEDNDLAKPYYWAGFVLSGDTSAISIDKDNNYLFYLFGLFLLVLALVLIKRFK